MSTDIYIAIDTDHFILGAARSLEGAKSLVYGDTTGAKLTWDDGPLGGSMCYIDRNNNWGLMHYATIDRQELID